MVNNQVLLWCHHKRSRESRGRCDNTILESSCYSFVPINISFTVCLTAVLTRLVTPASLPIPHSRPLTLLFPFLSWPQGDITKGEMTSIHNGHCLYGLDCWPINIIIKPVSLNTKINLLCPVLAGRVSNRELQWNGTFLFSWKSVLFFFSMSVLMLVCQKDFMPFNVVCRRIKKKCVICSGCVT